MEYEGVSSRYVPSRISLWCPVCGVGQSQGCKPVGGLRFSSHDAFATGQIVKPVIPVEWVSAPAKKVPFMSKGWVN